MSGTHDCKAPLGERTGALDGPQPKDEDQETGEGEVRRSKNLLDDLEHRTAAKLRRGAVENGSDGPSRSPLLTDDLPNIRFCHPQFNDEGVLPFDLGHSNLLRRIDQHSSHTKNQLSKLRERL